MFASVDAVQTAMETCGYITDRSLAMAVFLALRLRKPLLVEGEAGVGKTEVGKVLAQVLGSKLIRLQGYEGIDVSSAVYEWNYARQILAMRRSELAGGEAPDLYSSEFLIKRPILQAIDAPADQPPPVLLIDELDRADDEFEAFLLEALADFQVTIPEIGTIRPAQAPVVVITSNRTRELHEALKRRCLYHWIDYPSFEKECAVVASRIPDVLDDLRRQVVRFIQSLRRADLYKTPGIAETLDWAQALQVLGVGSLADSEVAGTLGLILKNQEDLAKVSGSELAELVETARRSG